MIRNHHERWDGRGYPDRLRGEEIALLARIMAVADAYHAIISDRPYHAAAAPEVAIRELRENAGTQFDPAIVEVAAAVIREHAPDEAVTVSA
jgi:HD-GYP domain-containing protein (c-di-GMP phosphodiesterase class II)